MRSLIGDAQHAIDELLGQVSQRFSEELLVLSAQSVAGAKHPGRQAGKVRWYGSQAGVVAIGRARVQVQRQRLRDAKREVAAPAYAALADGGDLPRRISDIMTCNVSTRKYARVVRRCADELGISKSALSRQFVKASTHAAVDKPPPSHTQKFGYSRGKSFMTFSRLPLLSGRPGLQAVNGMHRSPVSLHQAGDGTVHHALALQHALAGEHGRRHFDVEVAAAAVHVGPCIGDLALNGLAQRVDDGTLEVSWMGQHAVLLCISVTQHLT